MNMNFLPPYSPSPPPPPPPPPLPPRWLQPSPPDPPRSASQVSLLPAAATDDAPTRKLLLVYIHGFMGNESTFHAFPAHLHNLMCVTVAPLGYVMHTKVYPKFKTRHSILAAAEAFSRWLSPFECPTTDIVLLSHSMGGILAAEVVLLRDAAAAARSRHRILGILSFDTPFLGIHPGVITAGIGSLFRASPAASPPGQSTPDSFFSHTPQRNFSVAARKPEGPWDSTLHFIDKHHSRLTQATTQYLLSHLEFGACLADPVGLNQRYTTVLRTGTEFANYYTASTGRTKEPPTCEEMAAMEARRCEKEARENERLVHAHEKREAKEREKQERMAKELEKEAEKVERRKEKEAQKAKDEEEAKSLKDGETEKDTQADPERKRQAKQAAKIQKREEQEKAKAEKAERKEKKKQKTDNEIATDQQTHPPDSEAEHQPEYNHEKQELARLYSEQARMYAESRRMNGAPEPCDGKTTQAEQHESCTEPTPPPPKRERRFCILPRDFKENCWVKVPMDGVDEVGAHCGLFVPGPIYEQLVGDVATRIEGWLADMGSQSFAEQWM